MNEAVEQPVQQQESPVVEAPTSIMEHAKAFGPAAQREEAEPELKPIRPVDQQKRDQGKFAEGKQPMRGKDAVTRINQLTNRAKTAEERFADAEGRLANAERELSTLRQQRAPQQQIERAEARVERAEAATEPAARVTDPKDPEPQEDHAAFQGDYGKYLQAHARWAARDEYRQIRAGEANERAQAQRQEVARTALRTFGERITAAIGKYADFKQIALSRPAPWAEGSPIDAFVSEDDNGADVLYHLQHPTNQQEIDELLRLTPLQQLKRLSLLSQRFSSPPSAQPGTTGAGAGRQVIKLPPRPPTPVRTEAQSQGNHPPPTDGSLSIADHGRAFGPKRR